MPFNLSRADGNDPSLTFFEMKRLPSGKQTTIRIYAENPATYRQIDLKVVVDNLIMAPDTGLPVTLTFIPE